MRKRRADVGPLDDLAGVHDDGAVGDVGHDAPVVGDDQDRHAGGVLQVAQQLEDLGLHGDVEGRGRLVGDQELRPAGEREGDVDALGHAAGDLVRVRGEHPFGVGQLDLFQQFDSTRSPSCPRQVLVQADDLVEVAPDGVRRVEAAQGVLGHVGDA